MKIIFLVLFVVFSVCSAEIGIVCKNPINCKEAVKAFNNLTNENDSLKNFADIIKKEYEEKHKSDSLLRKIISDNITINDIEKMQELYNNAFDKMQNSFSSFINKVLIIITALGLFLGFLSFLNFSSANNLKKEAKEELKKVEEELEKVKKEIKIHEAKIKSIGEIQQRSSEDKSEDTVLGIASTKSENVKENKDWKDNSPKQGV